MSLYIKCCNCDCMIPYTSVDQHSSNCTTQSLKSIESSFLPATDQINIQIENMKKVFVIYKSTLPNLLPVWDTVLDFMDQLTSINEATNISILTLRKIICSIKMVIARYKGPYSGLLSINKIDVMAKEKYRLLVDNYKLLFSKRLSIKELEPLKTALTIARLSNYSINPSEERQSMCANNPSLQYSSSPPVNKSTEFIQTESKIDEALKRQFYYKCQVIKRKLGKHHEGFWVESAPLYSFVKKNQVPVSDWESFLEKELSENAASWIDPQQLSKLNLHKVNSKKKKMEVSKLKSIDESENSSREEI